MTAPRLCREDNWGEVLDDPAPRAVRWSTGRVHLFSEVFTRWHYTEGNGAFTACGRPVQINAEGAHTTFPEQGELGKVNCRLCLARMDDEGV